MRTVLFDIDGVLVHGWHARPERRNPWDIKLEKDMGVARADFVTHFIHETFLDNVLPGDRPLITELEQRLPALGYDGSPLDFLAYWLERDGNLNQPLLNAIDALRNTADARLYLATNQEHIRAYYLWTTLGLRAYFCDMFYAARLGAAKPDKRFFEAVDARIPQDNEPPLLFDDTSEIVEAANAHGWEAILYDELADFTGHPWVATRLSASA